jgi:predicted nuclease with TOPRIM domain
MDMSISTLRLYEIADNYLQALEDLAELEELPAEVIADTLEGLQGSFEAKAVSVGAYIKTLEAEASAIEEARKSMEQRQKALKRHADRLREYLKAQMERTGLRHIKVPPKRITAPCIILRLQTNPPSVVVEDEQRIPECYKQEVITVKVLKAEIAKALKGGEEVPGARLEQSNRLVIQ